MSQKDLFPKSVKMLELETRDVIEPTFFELESGRAFQDRARVGSSF